MNLSEAKNLKVGDYIYYVDENILPGKRPRAKVISIRTWRSDPARIQIGWKHGIYQYGKIYETTLDKWTTEK